MTSQLSILLSSIAWWSGELWLWLVKGRGSQSCEFGKVTGDHPSYSINIAQYEKFHVLKCHKEIIKKHLKVTLGMGAGGMGGGSMDKLF